MGDPINLRAARKLRDRAKDRAQADANAAKFGQTKIERMAQVARVEKAWRDLDGHARDGTSDPGPPEDR